MTTVLPETPQMPNFGRIQFTPEADLHIVPQLRTYLEGKNLPDPIDLHLSGHAAARKPSGWLSPSTHPTMSLRQLVLYLADPAAWKPQPFDDDTMVSAMMGTIFHEVFNIAFKDMGILVEPKDKTCPLCGRSRGRKPGADVCNEHAVVDPVLRRRGHIDDVIHLPRLGDIPVDVKTCAPEAIKHIKDHDTSVFTDNPTALKAKYYAQGQEYMDLRGDDRFMFLFASLGRPWHLREVIIERDQPHIDAVKAKYAAARELAPVYRRTGELPPECCTGTGKIHKECPATGCPIRRLR